jgi:hypothetical protein
MKKFLLKTIFAIAVVGLLSSCAAYHTGYMANSTSLCSNNFSYVKMGVKGTATATYILGIGGMARETLVDDAKKAMMSASPLKANQAWANLTVNFKKTMYVGYAYVIETCTVTADVVEFK